MTRKNALLKLAKYGVVQTNGRGRYFAQKGSWVVGFSMNGADTDDNHITCESVRHINDHSDMQADYHAEIYFDNLTQALNCAERLQCKEHM